MDGSRAPTSDPVQSSDIPACRNSGSVARSSARIAGPMRFRVTSQRRLPGSHTPPARCRMWAKSCGQRTATMRPSSANSTGPMRAGRGGGERTGDLGHERRAGTILRELPRELSQARATPGTQRPDRAPQRGQGFQLAMVRAHSRASVVSVTPGNSRRSSMAAANSPCCSTAARIAAASTSETTNIQGAWERVLRPASRCLSGIVAGRAGVAGATGAIVVAANLDRMAM